jgi:hypothetical protein
MTRSIPIAELKQLCMLSGGVCAFPGCDQRLVEPGTAADAAKVLGAVAHIVGHSSAGPRGRSRLTEAERNHHTNLILLCPTHHTLVDSQPNTFSVAVLRQLKADHEATIRRLTRPTAPDDAPELVQDTVHSTLLPVAHLPKVVFSAPCQLHSGQEAEVRGRLRRPSRDDLLCPFLLRDGRLLAFQDLRRPDNPFADVIDQGDVRMDRADELWGDAEGARRYVNLLNRSLYKHAGRLGIRYDPGHRRYYFAVLEPGQERTTTSRSVNGRRIRRKLAWQPTIRATGEARRFWWHLAVAVRFHQLDDAQWCLSLRPERHLTRDGVTSLPAEQIGRRVTRLKARMYNGAYLGEVNFWRDYLARGHPRIILDFGDQAAVINAELLTFTLRWPGIPGDAAAFTRPHADDDLFSIAELTAAVDGDPLDPDDPDADDLQERGA